MKFNLQFKILYEIYCGFCKLHENIKTKKEYCIIISSNIKITVNE